MRGSPSVRITLTAALLAVLGCGDLSEVECPGSGTLGEVVEFQIGYAAFAEWPGSEPPILTTAIVAAQVPEAWEVVAASYVTTAVGGDGIPTVGDTNPGLFCDVPEPPPGLKTVFFSEVFSETSPGDSGTLSIAFRLLGDIGSFPLAFGGAVDVSEVDTTTLEVPDQFGCGTVIEKTFLVRDAAAVPADSAPSRTLAIVALLAGLAMVVLAADQRTRFRVAARRQ